MPKRLPTHIIPRRGRQSFTDEDYVFALAVMARVVQIHGAGRSKNRRRLQQHLMMEDGVRVVRERRAQLKRVGELQAVLQRTGLKGYLDEAAT